MVAPRARPGTEPGLQASPSAPAIITTEPCRKLRTFDIGRQTVQLDKDTTIGLYDAERSIIDAFRMRESEGYEAGNEALRRWLRRRGSQPGHLIAMAADFPKAHAAIRRSLEILL